MTVAQALRDAIATLAKAGVASPDVDARALAAHVLGCPPLEVGLRGGELMPEDFHSLVAARAARTPLQHLLGTAAFGSLELHVEPGVFIPRPETELLAQWGVEQLGQTPAKVLDLCTGSGAIAAYIAAACPLAEILGVELSPTAAAIARKNTAPFPGIRIIEGDVCDPNLLPDQQFSLVISNPPYVPRSTDLSPEVYQDPDMAVFSGADGMECIRGMATNLVRWTAPGGWLGIEHDESTSDLVQQVLEEANAWEAIRPGNDLTGRPRFVFARRRRS